MEIDSLTGNNYNGISDHDRANEENDAESESYNELVGLAGGAGDDKGNDAVSYTHLTLPTNREV